MKKWNLGLTLSIVAGLAVASAGCGITTGTARNSISTYSGTATPGDVWSWTLNTVAGTFSATNDNGTPANTADDWTISGTLAVMPSKFLKLTVTSKSATAPTALATDGTAIAYGIEAPGLVFLVKPAGNNSPMIATLSTGSCGSFPGTYNYIRTAFGGTNANATNMDIYGNVTFSGTSAALTAAIQGYNPSGTAQTPNTATGSCSNGGITFSGNVRGTVAAAGGFMIDLGQSQGGVVGFKQNSLALADIGNRSYIGLYFKNNDTSGAVKPVKATFTSANAGTGAEMTNVDTGAVSATNAVTIALTNITNGLITGTLSDTGGSSPMYAASYTAGGATVLFLVSKDTGSNGPYNVLLVSQ